MSLLPTVDASQREVKFAHRAEHVRPGYYSVMLASGIRVELTATKRVAFHRYSFPADVSKGYIVLNLSQGIGWDKMTSCSFKQESDKTVSGYRMSTGWAKDQRVYFVAEFSQPVKLQSNEGDSIGVFADNNTEQPLLVKVLLVLIMPVRICKQSYLDGTSTTLWLKQSVNGIKSWVRLLSKHRMNMREKYSILPFIIR